MPRHRLAFFFLDEVPADRAVWQTWLDAAPPRLRAASTLGERRPFVEFAAPFASRTPINTRRADELDGLELVDQLLDQLAALSRTTTRSIGLLLSGKPFGTIGPDGRDEVVIGKLDEWNRLVTARPPDEPRWEREGWVSIWAGTLPREDFDRLLAERYGTEGPISPLARSLGLFFYDHDFLESVHYKQPLLAGVAIGKASFADSFVARIPDELCARLVDTVIVFYDTDFSQRPRDVARRRLRFFGSYPYAISRPDASAAGAET